ncbi:MAG: pseudouridine-5'-phosphate glycosidase [Candidatus Eremiobacteraeota bacterium]|nr:pseudouridine-5'-phosphate glycosidase [Candidatus Eremiobacteraeota bacterium]
MTRRPRACCTSVTFDAETLLLATKRRFVQIASDVAAALSNERPVVALETTILSHGMPYPENLHTARAVEKVVRDEGSTPATIAVIGGVVRIGLNDEDLEHLATATNVLKLSRADLAYAVATARDGATTVAATMLCAHLAGISVFATGGIGGVHRGASSSFDVSADLEELSRTPIVVVCAGAKAILDLPKTLEVLETKGVPVVGYGTDDFPAFWSRSSELRAPLRMNSPREIADFYAAQRELQVSSGILVANPVPVSDEIALTEMSKFIETAVTEAEKQGVTGKAVTPWVLDRIYRDTGGRSLRANIALVKNNARLAAQIARAVTQL